MEQLRSQVRGSVGGLCTINDTALEERVRLASSKSRLELDEKGLGNPTILLPLNLPDFEEEVKAREKRKMY